MNNSFNKPAISVVMSTYNDSAYLSESIDSVLSQTFKNFEFIIVNDGSPDPETQLILENFAAKDSRIKVIRKKNEGLTLALIEGCNVARGKYIARQDTGDFSFCSRLQKQYAYLEENNNISLASCWTNFVGPCDEELYHVERNDTPEVATKKLLNHDVKKIKGVTHHGSTMFRRKDYINAGGYRSQFYYAQDLDLWLRLINYGLLGFVPEILYKARFSELCISLTQNEKQVELAKILIELAKIRKKSGDEAELLQKAANIKPQQKIFLLQNNNVSGLYFIGKILLDRNDRRGVKYLSQVVKIHPLNIKAWLYLLYGMIKNL